MYEAEDIFDLNIETILDIGNIKYTHSEDIIKFYENFKSVVHGFLKIQGNLLYLLKFYLPLC